MPSKHEQTSSARRESSQIRKLRAASGRRNAVQRSIICMPLFPAKLIPNQRNINFINVTDTDVISHSLIYNMHAFEPRAFWNAGP